MQNKNLTALYHTLAVIVIGSCGTLIATGLNSIISSVFGIDNEFLTRIINASLVGLPIGLYVVKKVVKK